MYRRSMSGKLKKVVMFMRLSIIIVAAIYLDLLKIQSDFKKNSTERIFCESGNWDIFFSRNFLP